MTNIPKITPYDHTQWKCKQSKYEMVSELPTRALIVAPSNSGKSVLLQNIILDIYKGCFERIFILSPSIHIDSVWKPVIQYCEKELHQVEDDKNKYFFDTFDEAQFKNIIATQQKLIKHMKDRKMKQLYNIAIIIDDFLDNQKFLKRTPDLDMLFLRGRHVFISTVVSIQKYKGVSNVIGLNINDMYVFKLRNQFDLDSFVEEFSALADKKIIEHIYRIATNEPYGFLYVKLGSKDINHMFYSSLNKRFIIKNNFLYYII
jgi:hypothetical protein